MVHISGRSFPVLWSIIGAAVFVAIIHLFHRQQVVGGLIHDDDLKAEGQRDEAVGNVEQTVGRLGRKAGEAIEKVKKAFTR